MRALLLENPHPNADIALEKAGLEVVRHAGAMDEDELIAALDGVRILGIRSKTTVTERVLDAAPSLLAIGSFAIGTNQIDLSAAAHRGVAVFNAPFSNTRSVVELALGEIIALSRRLTVHDRALHDGIWNKSAAGSHEVRGRTLGIVGYGNIGTQLSVLAEALGMHVVFYDTAEKLALGNARRMGSLEELLDIADVVTLHVDGRAGNAGMFGAEQFARMRPGSIFLNLSRGFVVDYGALREHILAGKIVGAAVDVFPDEPKRTGDPFDSELRGLPNVILTPHIGGSTEEAQEAIGAFVSNKLASYLLEGTTTMSVNVPQLSLDPAPGARYRVTYLHRNTPGALALVNQAFAEHGANIEGQILGTSGDIGYVITDIGGELPEEARQALDEVPDTIRLRVLLAEHARA
ncbi:phosphoglycerate dehydrogenase [uncultured Georgenia sp.]|uniref:phosphoglycerate dehydrogenase n=1 Tax=uncultured Georgenia sp. TaxID=378209 RepID=UPI0026377FA6|nr:phosphoglycerate dehydrogenase [uncultured Georgenia sp.]HLV03757.1 phosphoglycerate dehydrogenase [Actinomycetaceae bacterium]